MKKSTSAGEIGFHDFLEAEESFEDAFRSGMSGRPKSIPCRFLYDERGSALFDEICGLEEYYPTRTETALLEARVREIAEIAGPDACLIELGSGSSVKTRILLGCMKSLAVYMPIDVSREHLRAAAGAIAADYPDIRVEAVCADYSADFALPDCGGGRRVAFFPGSTIGNLESDEAQALLKLWRGKLGQGGLMIVGVDLKKDPKVLEAAYDDASGVTEAFIKNILVRADRELDADFDTDDFDYEARWNGAAGRIEMHLTSKRDQSVKVGGDTIKLRAGERVHVENSHKYGVEEFSGLARAAGFATKARFMDDKRLFSVHVLAVD